MSSLIPFSFESHSVRAFNIDGNPWFVAKDVALALDYSESSNPARLFSSVPDEWKGVNPIHTLGGIQEVLCLKDVCDVLGYANASDAINQHCKGVAKRYPLQTTGGIQEVRILNEPDTYRLITGSTLPEAERFESWLFEDVLPSIRKTGGYQIPDTAHDLPVIESSLVLDFQGVPIRFLIALAATKSSGYDDDQVLNTPM